MCPCLSLCRSLAAVSGSQNWLVQWAVKHSCRAMMSCLVFCLLCSGTWQRLGIQAWEQTTVIVTFWQNASASPAKLEFLYILVEFCLVTGRSESSLECCNFLGYITHRPEAFWAFGEEEMTTLLQGSHWSGSSVYLMRMGKIEEEGFISVSD